MAKHIGVIACSSEGAALCYRTICLEAADIMGEENHPEITMHTPPFREYMTPIRNGDWEKVADVMVSSIEILKKVGAKVLITPDNTIHEAYDIARKKAKLGKTGIIWLHIAGVVAEEAQQRGYKRLGVLGTKYLLEGPVYRDILQDYKIDYVIPNLESRARINDIIFGELIFGKFRQESIDYFTGAIRQLKEQGCDAVVLGSTEIPLLMVENNPHRDQVPLDMLDSTRLLARAAVKEAMSPE
jgi:aspartate racemase